MLASDLGLAEGKSRFSYTVNAFSTLPEGLIDQTATAVWDSHRPPVSTGQFLELRPNEPGTIEPSADQAGVAATPVKGRLVVRPNDHSGAAQDDEVRLPR